MLIYWMITHLYHEWYGTSSSAQYCIRLAILYVMIEKTVSKKNMYMASHKYWEQLLFFELFGVVAGYNL